jgi:UDP-N-acetyl-D-glucosamine dehydrogenase
MLGVRPELASGFAAAALLEERIRSRAAVVGVVGLGYVGLPMALAFAEVGFKTLGFEVNRRRRRMLADGQSYIEGVAAEGIKRNTERSALAVSPNLERLAEPDAILVCLPTPLGEGHDPDVSILTNALSAIARTLRQGQLVILCSTTYPGTTEELALPTLESSGLQVGKDFFLAYSPERMDPGNRWFPLNEIPRVLAGVTPDCTALADQLLSSLAVKIHKVANCRTAEMTKLLENTFRAVNIALVNEMAIICRKLDIEIWDVIDAASTKPFGYTRFEPGPGLGGHCIPVDPAYLAWRLRVLNYRARFVELAEDINEAMPDYCANLVANALDERGQAVRGARILALGVAYKADVADARESPSIEVIRQLASRGARMSIHDPYVQESCVAGLAISGGEPSDDLVRQQDCVVILTAHSVYDWDRILKHARLLVDTRGVTRGRRSANIIRL